MVTSRVQSLLVRRWEESTGGASSSRRPKWLPSDTVLLSHLKKEINSWRLQSKWNKNWNVNLEFRICNLTSSVSGPSFDASWALTFRLTPTKTPRRTSAFISKGTPLKLNLGINWKRIEKNQLLIYLIWHPPTLIYFHLYWSFQFEYSHHLEEKINSKMRRIICGWQSINYSNSIIRVSCKMEEERMGEDGRVERVPRLTFAPQLCNTSRNSHGFGNKTSKGEIRSASLQDSNFHSYPTE